MSTVENLYFFSVGTTERSLSLITASFVHRSVDPCIYYIRERINSFPIYKKRAEMAMQMGKEKTYNKSPSASCYTEYDQ